MSICAVADRRTIAQAVVYLCGPNVVAEAEANARLIAAAPELLATLKVMISPGQHRSGCLFLGRRNLPCQCGYNERINTALQQASEAIAKAEGRITAPEAQSRAQAEHPEDAKA